MLAPSTSEIELANAALGHCREAALSSLTSDRLAARRVQEQWGNVRDALLRETDWNFARTEARLAADPAPPLTTAYAYRCGLPEACLAVRAVDALDENDWEVESESSVDGPVVTWLLSPIASPLVHFTRREGNVAKWDPLFRRVFELRLAASVGPMLSLSANEAEALNQQAEGLLMRAKRLDAREQAVKTLSRDTSWIAARRGWRG